MLAGNGGLYEFCPYTKFLNRIDTENGWPIIDFSMQDTNDDDIDVVILAQNAENEYYMKILDYKGILQPATHYQTYLFEFLIILVFYINRLEI